MRTRTLTRRHVTLAQPHQSKQREKRGNHEQSAGCDRPGDCECWSEKQELPCFQCFRAGFEMPNPEATRGDRE